MGNWIPNDPTLVAQILKISSAYTPPPPEGNSWGGPPRLAGPFSTCGRLHFRLGLFQLMFLRDKDWAQVVKTNHYLSHHYL
jgi:hypothetical protein